LNNGYRDPSHVAAEIIGMLVTKYGLTEKEAMLSFLRSHTFKRMMEDHCLAQLPSEEILSMYEQEAS